MNGILGFFKRHLIITNLLIMVIVAILLCWLTLCWLDSFTRHGNDIKVPDVKGMTVDTAVDVLQSQGFEVELDSMYLEEGVPGTIREQTPPALALVKPGKTVNIRYICFTRKMAHIPSDFYGMSGRAAADVLKSLGMVVNVEYVPSSFDGILVSATYNGRRIHNGQEIPMGSVINVKIGESLDYSTLIGDSLDEEDWDFSDEIRILPDNETEADFSEQEELITLPY